MPGGYSWNGNVVEGIGVLPDVEVPLSIAELRRRTDSQLEAAIAEVLAMTNERAAEPMLN